MSIVERAIESLSIKREEVKVRLPDPSDKSLFFEFVFEVSKDYSEYRKRLMAASEFGQACQEASPAMMMQYGEFLPKDAAVGAACQLLSALMKRFRLVRITTENDESIETIEAEEGGWKVSDFMRFAKTCGPMFMQLTAAIDRENMNAMVDGENRAVDAAKKNYVKTDITEDSSPSQEN